MAADQQTKVATSTIWSPTKFTSSAADSPSSPKRAKLSWMEDDPGEHYSGGASSGGASQDGINVLYELCVGSQVYDATALALHDDMGGGS